MYYKFITCLKIKYMTVAERMGRRNWNTAVRFLHTVWYV